MSLKLRIIIGACLVVALCLVQLFSTISLTKEVAIDIDTVENKNLVLIKHINQVKIDVIQVQQWLTDISATREMDGLDDGFKEADKAALSFRQSIDSIQGLDSSYQGDVDKLKRAFEAYYQVGKRMANDYISEGPARGNQTMGEFDRVASALAAQFDELETRVFSEIEQEFVVLHDDFDQMHNTAVVLQTLIAIVVLGFGAYLIVSVRKPIVELASDIRKLHQGEVSTEVQISQRKIPELNDVSNEFNELITKIRSVVSALVEEVISSSAAIDQISARMQETESLVCRLRDETSSQASALTEMQATSEDVASNAMSISENVNSAKTDLESGSRLVMDTADNIGEVAVQTEKSEKNIYELKERMTSISSMLETIKGIAEQTNLLALNAAIEAARAGEQGRGFAVVADEVRNLASKTQDSSLQIEDILGDLLTSISDAVSSMETSRSAMDISVNSASQSSEIITKVNDFINDIDQLVTETAQSMQQQSEVAEEQVKTIVSLDELSNTTADVVTDVNAGVSEIRNRMHSIIEYASKLA